MSTASRISGICCLAALSTPAWAAGPSAELHVVGRILPGVCQPTLGGGGSANFGTIGQDSFRGKKRLALPGQNVDFSIACDVPMRVSVTPSDNQAHSADGQVSAELDGHDAAHADDIFGLGHDGEHRLGGYLARFVRGSMVADGRPVDAIASTDGRGWTRRDGGQIRHGIANSWAPAGSSKPVAFRNMHGALHIKPVLNTKENRAQDADMNGSLTLELDYL